MPRIEIEPGVFFQDDIGTAYSVIKPLLEKRDELKSKVKELETDLGLTQIALEGKVALLNSCETALSDRDAQLSEAQEEIERLREALTDLVELKAHKDFKGKDGLYIISMPNAWERARAALKPNGEG